MNIKNNKLFFKYLFYSVVGLIYIIILINIFKIIDVYYSTTLYLLIFIYFLVGINIYFNKKEYFVILYFLTLFIFLLFRDSEYGYNFDFYLWKWLKNIFKNKTIFINILGNIILFIPMGILYHKKILTAFFFCIMFEFIQFIFRKGIFDIVDIVLNFIGIIIGVLGVTIWNQIKKNKVARKRG